MDEWYVVEDNHPEDQEQVLITGFRDATRDRYVAVATYDEKSDTYFDDDDEGQRWEYIDVRHWCYIPDTDELE